ncbi:MAG: NAD-dependent epimerase/dehydratase family protein [Endomicrobiales bacterium]|nr:NAD-dependent epimerase/dehydratase family protein [Endomicrobiales bacterium]
MKILVTGANGFVGSHIVESLLEKGHKVACLVRKTSNLNWLKDKQIEYKYGDIIEPETLTDPVKEADAVIHAAGVVRALKRETYFKVNQEGTKNLVESILKNNPKLKKLIYISSQAAVGPSTTNRPKSLDEPDNPVSFYGKSKLQGEKELKILYNKVPYTILCPSSVYGPRDRDILIFFSLVQHGFRPLPLKKRLIQMIFVKDLAKITAEVLDSRLTDYKKYFIAENNHYTWEEIGKTISKALNKKTIPIPLPDILFYTVSFFAEIVSKISNKPAVLNREKIDEMIQNYWIADTEPIRRDLNIGFTKLENGAKITYSWYKQNKWL